MGYTQSMLFAAILLSPILMAIAAVLFFIGRWARILPAGVPWLVNFLLACCLTWGSLFLYADATEVVLHPAQLQQRYLGARYGTPLNLRSYRHQPSVMDPASFYYYALPNDQAEALRHRCRSRYSDPGDTGCILFHHRDQRWIMAIRLSDRNELQILDVLW